MQLSCQSDFRKFCRGRINGLDNDHVGSGLWMDRDEQRRILDDNIGRNRQWQWQRELWRCGERRTGARRNARSRRGNIHGEPGEWMRVCA